MEAAGPAESENEGVKARIAELKHRNAEKCEMARAEAVQYFLGCQTQGGDYGVEGLANRFMATQRPRGESFDFA